MDIVRFQCKFQCKCQRECQRESSSVWRWSDIELVLKCDALIAAKKSVGKGVVKSVGKNLELLSEVP